MKKADASKPADFRGGYIIPLNRKKPKKKTININLDDYNPKNTA